ncbi:hypothetical protein GIB67_022861 [Kingdonia uniflora]|uniref:Major facilitator superfamily (MFS) profile domain-containing protein n=1 Tax=Kingdonia uniflora TaxID=39325 RepID=A0A7J7P758_9MAGN|nr:hypothetical protein GIB67_022861 [Kingdonia uniflora]
MSYTICVATIGGEYVSVKSAGNLFTRFDVGGIVGGILAGYIFDKLSARATTTTTFMYAAIPAMFLYRVYGRVSKSLNILLMMVAGLLVNRPYALITTTVSADLGSYYSVKGNSQALATVSAIIDGVGSAGAAIGPLLTGFLSSKGWDAALTILVIGAFIARLLLSAEIIEKSSKHRQLQVRLHNLFYRIKGFGLASHLGGLADLPIIRIGKNLCLLSEVASNSEIVYGYALKIGFESDVFVSGALVNSYSKFGRVEDARRLFDGMDERDVILWNVMLKAYNLYHLMKYPCGRIECSAANATPIIHTCSAMLEVATSPASD